MFEIDILQIRRLKLTAAILSWIFVPVKKKDPSHTAKQTASVYTANWFYQGGENLPRKHELCQNTKIIQLMLLLFDTFVIF